MGEYATYQGSRIKIGTCEDMYYLRWDQRHLVQHSETPLYDPAVLAHLRFRFPFPGEEGIAPGEFEDPWKHYPLMASAMPAELEHSSVQFRATGGYLLSLPCPEAEYVEPGYERRSAGHRVMLNGYGGRVHLVQQGFRSGHLAAIASCGGCGAKWAMSEEAAYAAVEPSSPIGQRVMAGYRITAP